MVTKCYIQSLLKTLVIYFSKTCWHSWFPTYKFLFNEHPWHLFANLKTYWYTCLEYKRIRIREISYLLRIGRCTFKPYLILFIKLTDFKPFMPQRTLYIPCTMKVHPSPSKYNYFLEDSKSTFIQKYTLVHHSNLFGTFHY